MTILGISIGTARTAVCVLHKGNLVFRNIYNNQTAWSDKKLLVILKRYERYIAEYRVKGIIIKIPPIRRHNEAITQLVTGIEKLAKKYDCPFDLVTKSELKHLTSLRSTNEIIEYTRMLFPELTTLFEKGKRTDHSYYMKLYEAVLSAYIFQDRIGTRSRLQLNREE